MKQFFLLTLLSLTMHCYGSDQSSICISDTSKANPSQPASAQAYPWAHAQLQKLSLEQKIGQLFMVAAVSDSVLNTEFMQESVYTMNQEHIEHLIKTYGVGGVIFLGMGMPAQQHALTQHYQWLSATPLLIGQDLEWGLTMRLCNTLRFPRNMTLGAVTDDTLVYSMGYEIGLQMKALNVHINFAPVVDINNNAQNPVINDRSFGQDKALVARKASMFMRGLRDAGIIACAKHFPGHGNTATDSHYVLPLLGHTREQLDATELYPFKKMIRQGIPAIMTAHLEVPALEQKPNVPTSLSYATVTQLLKHELGFKGLVITDGLGMAAVTKDRAAGTPELEAFLAGNDILLCPVDVDQAVLNIKQAIAEGVITEAQLDERVYKILCAKEWAGAHKKSEPTVYNDQTLHTPDAQALKQQLYAQAVTVVKDSTHALPVNNPATYIQIGGTPSTPFYETVSHHIPLYVYKQPVDESAGMISNDLSSSLASNSTCIIAIYDMNKFYARNFGITVSTLKFIEAVQTVHSNVIIVLFGSPYSVGLFSRTPTIVMAYEDDPDAQIAAAHVVVGKATARGKLPVIPLTIN